MWSKVVLSGANSTGRGKNQNQAEAAVDFIADTPKYGLDEPDETEILLAFASLMVREIRKRWRHPITGIHVSRQSPNTRRRKRASQGAGGVQAGDRREIRPTILYHQLGRQSCSSLSLRRVGADRAEACGIVDLQSHQEEISRPCELLGPAGGNGRPGPIVDAAASPRGSADQRRSGGDRAVDLSEVRNLEQYRREIEENKFTPEDEKTLDELGI
jgi:hypothetical protein